MKKDRKRKKETLFLNEKLRGFVITVWKKFIPLVQCCPCWIEHDMVLLKSAQPTGVSCWIPWRTPILHLPLYVVGDAFGLVVVVLPLQLLPDVPWQLCVSSLFLFPKGPSMAIPPGLEVGGSTSVGLFVSIVSSCDMGPVHNIVLVTLAWHGTPCFVSCLTIAMRNFLQFRMLFFSPFLKLLVVTFWNVSFHIGHCSVRDLDGVSVTDLVQFVSWGKTILHNLKEHLTHICLHIQGIWWIKPCDSPLAIFLPLLWRLLLL